MSYYRDNRRFLAAKPDAQLVAAWRDLRRVWPPSKIRAGYEELYRRGLAEEAQAGFPARLSRWRRFYGLTMVALFFGVVVFTVAALALH